MLKHAAADYGPHAEFGCGGKGSGAFNFIAKYDAARHDAYFFGGTARDPVEDRTKLFCIVPAKLTAARPTVSEPDRILARHRLLFCN